MLLKISLFLLLVACTPCSPEYQEFYLHLQDIPRRPVSEATDYYIIFLVNARHLDYSDCRSFIHTVAKHPSDGSKNGDVGHAWIYLKGDEVIEGGHSGELGIWQPRYIDGMLDNLYQGAQDPVKYLWCSQCDGFFQRGNGGHLPTFAAKVDLTHEQYKQIQEYVATYPFNEYAITGRQCASFVKEVASLIGIELEDKVTLEIDQWFYYKGYWWQMWQDPQYQKLTFSSPDRLEKSLMQLVHAGQAENALAWYCKTHPVPISQRITEFFESLMRFPERVNRVL